MVSFKYICVYFHHRNLGEKASSNVTGDLRIFVQNGVGGCSTLNRNSTVFHPCFFFWNHVVISDLGGGTSNLFYFHPYLGKIPNLTNIFQRGWNHQLGHFWWFLLVVFFYFHSNLFRHHPFFQALVLSAISSRSSRCLWHDMTGPGVFCPDYKGMGL